MGNDLMINDLNKSGKFLRGDTLPGVFVRTAGPRAVLMVDIDNDGDQDLHRLEGSKVDIMLRNVGHDVFVDVVNEVGLAKTESPGGWGLMDINDRGGETFADGDADGDLDLFLPGSDGTKPFLMQNNGGNAKNWLEVRLTGVVSNKSAIGARVTVVTGSLRQSHEMDNDEKHKQILFIFWYRQEEVPKRFKLH